GVARAQLELRDPDDAAAWHGDGDQDGLTRSCRDAAHSSARQAANLDVAALDARIIPEHELEACLAAGERIHLRGHIHLQAEKIAIAVMHGDRGTLALQ